MDAIKRVQDLMQARDMNLCVLAKKCGISYSTIQTTARRGGQLSVETIERICLGLGITPRINSDLTFYAVCTHDFSRLKKLFFHITDFLRLT